MSVTKQKKTKRIVLISALLLFSFLSFLIIGSATGTEHQHLKSSNEGQNRFEVDPVVSKVRPSQGVIDNNTDKLIYWVQASDIHINMQEEEEFIERNQKFDEFCAEIKDTIKPAFVVSTGDNVDADEKTMFYYYNQNEAE